MYLIDTNVISELRKVLIGKANAQVVSWVDSIDAAELYVSVITMHELKMGVLLAGRRDAAKAAVLNAWYEQVTQAFKNRILVVDMSVVTLSASLNVPNPRPFGDCLIAATALAHNMTVATRNVVDFQGTGVKLINPWETDCQS
jgi:hypothetical protein